MQKAYKDLNIEDLKFLKEDLEKKYDAYKSLNLKLDMSRGKPGPDQLDLLDDLLTVKNYITDNHIDTRNYGGIDGISEIKTLFSELLGASEEEIIAGGNSSLNMMYDTIQRLIMFGVSKDSIPWGKQHTPDKKIKFLCPVPGYDRHFAITELFGFDMINIDMNEDGPDMDKIEELVKNDVSIKGIWCVPKYSNPTGITFSDEVVKRFAKLDTKADDFTIFWDNAYVVHDLDESPDALLNLLEESKKYGNENKVFMFASTSKISFPGAGVAAMASSRKNIDYIKKLISLQTIGPNKLNQLHHALFFKNLDGIRNMMRKHAVILKPKFDIVLNILKKEFEGAEIAFWSNPKGGYFINFDAMDGCAKDTIELAKNCGVVMTPAGSTFPHMKDPCDKNIRIAPTFPCIEELEKAMEVLCVCVKLVSINKLLGVKG